MRLNKLILKGFKSFANKTEIVFTPGVTTIVGPNGSGKSNISDAVRWVLGEQSNKSLRANKASDVIFQGTEEKKALGYAQVSIIFSNDDNALPVEYQEVEVTRRMYRSGESEFFINNKKARMKDVRELFLDTGVGKDGYSIIGQGRIDEILSNKPEDRRAIFEEASGVSKYRYKKEESLRKLDKTEANLLRIKDILYEIEQNEARLKGESEKAREYKGLMEEYKKVDVSISYNAYEKIEKNLLKFTADKDRLIDDLKLSEIKNKEVEESAAPLQAELKKYEALIDEIKEQRNKDLRDFDINRQKLEINKEKLKSIEDKVLDNKLKEKEHENKLLESEEKIKTLSLVKKSSEETLLKIAKDLEALKNENASYDRTSYDDAMNMGLVLDKELEALRISIENKNNNKTTQNEKLTDIEKKISDKENELNKQNDEFDKVNNNLNDLTKTFSEKEELYKKAKDEITAKVDDLAKSKDAYFALENDIRVLEKSYEMHKNLEENLDGYYRSVKEIAKAAKKKYFKSDSRLVVDIFNCDEKYSLAIESALQSNLQAIVIDRDDDAKEYIDFLKKNNYGRATFYPLNRYTSRSNENYNIKDKDAIGFASELITYDKKYDNLFKSLLQRTVVTTTFDAALRISKVYKQYRYVSLDGQIINSSGSIVGGSQVKSSFISRKHMLTKLMDEINEKKKSLEAAKAALINNEEEIKSEKTSYDKLNEEIIAINEKINSAKKEINSLEINIAFAQRDISEAKTQREELTRSLEALEEEIAQGAKDLEELKSKKLEHEKTIEAEKELIKGFEEEKDRRNEKLLQISVEKSTLEAKLERTVEDIAISQEYIAKSQEIKDGLASDFKELSQNKEALENENASIMDFLKKNEELEQEYIDKINQKTDEKEKVLSKIFDLQNEIKTCQESIIAIKDEINKNEVLLARNEVMKDNIKEKLSNDYFINVENIDKDSLVKASSKDLKELQEKIDALGDVSLSSIKEYEDTLTRLEFLRKQYDDMQESKEDLLNIIDDIDETIKIKFKDNFNIIQGYFSEIFQNLFGGGEAKIYISDESDILNSGIEIEARPPGKSMQSLSLLSGGEKTLTAIALLFAVLKSKPSPFCILDEIDAALDDANISKYTAYLDRIKEETQFILITHRKVTMEISDAIYGITMKEKGISSILSMKLT
ncbi:MAG: chromosome segregation protein SMC [Eubacteriales bacterium]|uniref:chromosome segregation protein SMC n=1 Tax=Fenollaria sp. TaxID=1965292 RepID=UPI002A766BCA|nr:chromosome segregation protein SMC [Fenollaria sp.]MDD7339026.1 chromosome segregation protein SMC [Eubacteriales bacterium]MDY3106495.1 chromosome segregation protein SMC [Fenollaria sp.]